MVLCYTFLSVNTLNNTPLTSVVDITNDFSVCILQVLANPHTNTVFSPYGLVSVLILIHEGANSSSMSSKEIERGLRLPRHKDLTQLGFRDLHRYLKSYFTSDGFLRGLVLSNPKAILSQNYLRKLKYYGFEPDVPVETTTQTVLKDHKITIQNISSTISPIRNYTKPTTAIINNKIFDKNYDINEPDKNVTFIKPKNVTINKGIITPMYRPSTKPIETSMQSSQTTTKCIDNNESQSIQNREQPTPQLVKNNEIVICPTLDTSLPLPTRINFETTNEPDPPPFITDSILFSTITTEITTKLKPETEPTTKKDIEETTSITTPKTPTTVIKKSTTNFKSNTLTDINEILETASSFTSPSYSTTEKVTTDYTESTLNSIFSEEITEKIMETNNTTTTLIFETTTINKNESETNLTTSSEETLKEFSLQKTKLPVQTFTEDNSLIFTTSTPSKTSNEDEYIHLYDEDDDNDKIEPKISDITTTGSSVIEDKTFDVIEAIVEEITRPNTKSPENIDESTNIQTTDNIDLINREMTNTEINDLKDFSTTEPTIATILTSPTTSIEIKLETTTSQTETTQINTETTINDSIKPEFSSTIKVNKKPKTKDKIKDNSDESVDLDSPITILKEGLNDILDLSSRSEKIKEQKTNESDLDSTSNFTTFDNTLFSNWVTDPTIFSSNNKTETTKDYSNSRKNKSRSLKNKTSNFFEDYINHLNNMELNKTKTTEYPEFDLYFSDDTERLVTNLSDININLTDYINGYDDEKSDEYRRRKRSINGGRYRMANWLEGARYRDPSKQWFSSFNGEQLVPVLTVKAFLPYADIPSLGAQALQIPLDVDYYTMLILLPKHRMGLKALLNSLEWCSIRTIIASLRTTPIYAVIPTFTMVHHVNMVDALIKLGIRDIFDARKADLTEMSRDPYLHVRSVEQVVTMSVREHYNNNNQHRWYDATETQIQQQFLATHPFVFFVIDTETQVSLVAGTMINPALRPSGN